MAGGHWQASASDWWLRASAGEGGGSPDAVHHQLTQVLHDRKECLAEQTFKVVHKLELQMGVAGDRTALWLQMGGGSIWEGGLDACANFVNREK